MKIDQAIADWDGKSAADIEAIYTRYSGEGAFATYLIELAGREHLEKGATWLIKHHLENNQGFNTSEISALYALLPGFAHWEARLHVLQCIPKLPIGESEKPGLEGFLRRCLIDDNKFVRAWGYNGFYELSRQYPEHQEEAKQFLDMAMQDEAPSVKARVRNLIKRGF